jgi:hypothetical protein
MDYKQLWLRLLNALAQGQTSWGKNQLIEIMKEMELDEARKDG